MTDALLIFTFSPIQSFISEARRAADLYASSRILVELAQSAAVAIGKESLIYPSAITDDVPNKMVARVDWDTCEQIAKDAHTALLTRWQEIANDSLKEFNRMADSQWIEIWNRQVYCDPQKRESNFWEIYWAAVRLENEAKYQDAYQEAERALAAVKRMRTFNAVEESGVKDSLSGCRQALHPSGTKTEAYWSATANKIDSSKLRLGERLDAFGVIKRFRPLDAAARHRIRPYRGFPSTSSVASADYLNQLSKIETINNPDSPLAIYRKSFQEDFPAVHTVSEYTFWPYDGDLLYRDTLTEKHFLQDYNLQVSENALQPLQTTLEKLYKLGNPSSYYAIVAFDGDNMGKRVNQCRSAQEHQELSRKLTSFAAQVHQIASASLAQVIYNGGDDVLAMAPLSQAFSFACDLAKFFKTITGGTASAGIAIAHHQSPLSAALRQAREAESLAKKIDDERNIQSAQPKAAICVTVLKRSGETLQVRTKWDDVNSNVLDLMDLFKKPKEGDALLASRFAYDVLHSVYALPEANAQFLAELKRLLKRHRKDETALDVTYWADRLHRWAQLLPGGPEELANWLLFTRFIAQGGGE